MPDANEGKSASDARSFLSGSVCVVFLGKEEFLDVLSRQEEPLLVCCLRGTFRSRYVYLTCYRGLLFGHRSKNPIPLEGCELINAEEIRLCGRRLQ